MNGYNYQVVQLINDGLTLLEYSQFSALSCHVLSYWFSNIFFNAQVAKRRDCPLVSRILLAINWWDRRKAVPKFSPLWGASCPLEVPLKEPHDIRPKIAQRCWDSQQLDVTRLFGFWTAPIHFRLFETVFQVFSVDSPTIFHKDWGPERPPRPTASAGTRAPARDYGPRPRIFWMFWLNFCGLFMLGIYKPFSDWRWGFYWGI